MPAVRDNDPACLAQEIHLLCGPYHGLIALAEDPEGPVRPAQPFFYPFALPVCLVQRAAVPPDYRCQDKNIGCGKEDLANFGGIKSRRLTLEFQPAKGQGNSNGKG